MLGELCSPVGEEPAGFCFGSPLTPWSSCAGWAVRPDYHAAMFGVQDYYHFEGKIGSNARWLIADGLGMWRRMHLTAVRRAKREGRLARNAQGQVEHLHNGKL
jgi:hypothetical protein